MTPLQELKQLLSVGNKVAVTNHYITRRDHPCFGTTVRTVTKNNTLSWSYFEPNHDSDHAVAYPKAKHVKRRTDGGFDIFGHPSASDALFLTIYSVAS